MATNIAGADPWQYRCPECGSTTIRAKGGGIECNRDHPEDYRCNHCNHHFDEPVDMKRADAAQAD